MASSTEVAKQVRLALESMPGVRSITVDGLRVDVDRSALDYWEKRALRESVPVKRPIAASIRLDG